MFAFKLKNSPKFTIFGPFWKIKISIADCEKIKKDIQKPERTFVKHDLKMVSFDFESKKGQNPGT